MSSGPIELSSTPLIGGLCFLESPRWHDGRLWFSDMHGGRVYAVNEAGACAAIVDVPEQPSGLGWRSDGTLLIVSMIDRALLHFAHGRLETVAALAALAPFHCNDMLVDGQGRAYIGNFGFDFEARATAATTVLIRVDADGSSRAVADDLLFPNGMVLTPDGRTLIVAETMRNRLTAFTVDSDGDLSARRVWADLGEAAPDGICLDAAGALWIASPPTQSVLRIEPGGAVTHRVMVEDQAIACMLGGADRRTLFVLSAPLRRARKTTVMRRGRIDTVRVDIAGAGLP
jgi:sugar lactone lactonase YvrE